MNSKQDEILTILAEECAEVIVAVSKVRRFGLEQNVQALKQELADVCWIWWNRFMWYHTNPRNWRLWSWPSRKN